MCLSSSMVNVFADDTSTDDHTTNINYTVEESYKWQALADIVFTSNIDNETKSGSVSVLENIIEATKTLVISIGPDEDFKLTSAEGAQRDYTVSKDSEVLSAGSRVLLVPSGTYSGTQDLDFELQGVVSGNTSQKAGVYNGTLNFEAVLTSNYRIEYHMNGGTNNPANPAEYEKDAGDVTLQNPTKDGYSFEGWFTEPEFTNQVTSIANGTEGNIDLYAKWEAAAYTITYELNGGTNNASNPTGYNVTETPITLLSPTKSGYTFLGWTGSNGNSPEINVTIPAGETGNLEYIANWDVKVVAAVFLDGTELSWDELQQEANGATYGYRADLITDDALLYDDNTYKGAFSNCNQLVSLNIPSTVTSIGASAFSNNTNLSKINSDIEGVFNIPTTISTIDRAAFNGCTSATVINIPDAIDSFNSNTLFAWCSSLTTVNIPFEKEVNNVIGYEMFQEDSNLTTINGMSSKFTVPSNITGVNATPFCLNTATLDCQ